MFTCWSISLLFHFVYIHIYIYIYVNTYIFIFVFIVLYYCMSTWGVLDRSALIVMCGWGTSRYNNPFLINGVRFWVDALGLMLEVLRGYPKSPCTQSFQNPSTKECTLNYKDYSLINSFWKP